LRRKPGIVTKISILVFSAIVSTLLIVFLGSFVSFLEMKKSNQEELRKILFEERKQKLVELTDNASTVIENSPGHYAAKAVAAMRFGEGNKNYFFVFDETGRFVCQSGEMVQFMIGDVVLGEVQAKDVVTPMDFVDPAELYMGFNNPMLVNMGRFLQSLDADGNPENGITITQEVRDQVSGRMIDFHQSIRDFENDPDVMAMFATMNGLNMPHNGTAWELVDGEGARQHMIDHMGKYMTDSMKVIMNEQMGAGTQSGDVDNLPMNNGNTMGNQNAPMGETTNNNMGSGAQSGGDVGVTPTFVQPSAK